MAAVLDTSISGRRVEIAAWVEYYNQERPHSSLGYATPAAFAAELDKHWLASTALMSKTTARLRSQLGKAWDHVIAKAV